MNERIGAEQGNNYPDYISRSRYTSIFELIIDPLYQVRLLWQHKWELLAVVLMAGLLGALASYIVEPTYRATATMVIQTEGAEVAPIKDIYEKESSNEYVLTHHEVLRSRELAGRVVDRLNLTEHPAFKPSEQEAEKPGSQTRMDLILAKIPFLSDLLSDDKAATPTANQDPREAAISKLQKIVKVEAVPLTLVVRVHAETGQPELSANIANTLVQSFIQYYSGERLDLTEEASGWLNKRLEELKKNLNESEARLQQFYQDEELVNVGGARNLITDEYSDNSERLRDATRRREELTSIYRKVKAADGDIEQLQRIAYIQDKDIVQIAKRQYLEAREKASELESRYGEKHPRMIAARARTKEAKEAYEQQMLQASEAIKSEYDFALDTERSLAKILSSSRQQLEKLDRKQYTLEALQQEVASNRQLYDSFLQRYKETDIASNLESSNNRILDRAIPPNRVHSPNRTIWVLSSTVIGFLFAFGVIFIRALMDDTVKSTEAMEELCHAPVLAVLPKVKSLSNKETAMARVELDEPSSAYAEAIRTLRTSIVLADAGQTKGRIMVASSVPAEGKSCIAANLAIAFSQVEPTVLIDCDLRKPSSAKYLNIDVNHIGLVEAISGQAPIAQATKRLTATKLDVLSCVKPPPNPTELLGSERFATLLETLSASYSRIIIDTPPCQVVSDALLLAGKMDAVIFAAKADSTYRRTVADAINRLRQAGGNVLGAVLNQADLSKSAQYGVYYYPEYYGSQST